jgi:gliding motility-associated-like protein
MTAVQHLRNFLSSLFLLFAVVQIFVPQAQNLEFKGAQFTFTWNGGNANPVCGDDTLDFAYTGATTVDSLYWDFGDPLSGVNNNDTGVAAGHLYGVSQSYTVQLNGYLAGVAIDSITGTFDLVTTPAIIDTIIPNCQGDTVVLSAAHPFSTFNWSIPGQVDSILNVTSPGVYTCNVTNLCGTTVQTYTIQQLDTVVVDLGIDFSICVGDSIPISVAQAPAMPNVTYLWSDGSTGSEIWLTTQGNYAVTVTNDCGAGTDDVVVSIPPPLTVSVDPDTLICQGQSYTITATTNQPNVQYQWMGNPNNGGTTFTVNSGGTYWVAATNDCEFAYDTIVISQPVSFILDLGPDTIICNGDQITIDPGLGVTGYTYLWNDNSVGDTLTVNAPGTYYVEVSDSCSIQSDTIVISTPAPFVVDLGNDTTYCANDVIILDPNLGPGYTYVWQDGSTLSTYQVLAVGTYSVTVSDACQSVTDDIDFAPFTGFTVSLGNDTTICDGQSFQLSVVFPNSSYLWQDGSTDPVYTVTSPGEYYVTIGNICDTVQSDTVSVEVDPCSCNMYVPNAFTPNLDGKNEFFGPITDFTECVVLEYEMRIFNRWGQEVFVGEDIADRWDGFFQDQVAQDNVYYYEITYSIRNQGDNRIRQERLTGNVFVIK